MKLRHFVLSLMFLVLVAPFCMAQETGDLPAYAALLQQLVMFAIPIVGGLIVKVITTFVPNLINKAGNMWTPLLAGLVGVLATFIANIAGALSLGGEWWQALLTLAIGGMLGFASTGLHQVAKQYEKAKALEG